MGKTTTYMHLQADDLTVKTLMLFRGRLDPGTVVVRRRRRR